MLYLLTSDLALLCQQTDSSQGKLDEFMKPLPKADIGDATSFPPTDEMNKWADTGLKAIADGKVAALLLAGGQVCARALPWQKQRREAREGVCVRAFKRAFRWVYLDGRTLV